MHTQHYGGRRLRPGQFLLLFGYVWLTVGLFTATLALVSLRDPVLAVLRGLGADDVTQSRAVFSLVLASLFASVVFARRITRRLARADSPRLRQTGVGLLAVSALLSIWAWSRPTSAVADPPSPPAAHAK